MESMETGTMSEHSSSSSESPEASNEAMATSSGDIAHLQALEAQIKEKENKYLYLYAEFENFKKRAQKERMDLILYGWEGTARDLLGVLDNLDRAYKHGSAQPLTGSAKAVVDGVEMVVRQFSSVFEQAGVKKIQAIGKPFDPLFHEAVAQEHSDAAAGTVIAEQAAGYMLHQRLLRASQVTVSLGNLDSNNESVS